MSLALAQAPFFWIALLWHGPMFAVLTELLIFAALAAGVEWARWADEAQHE